METDHKDDEGVPNETDEEDDGEGDGDNIEGEPSDHCLVVSQ